MPEIYFNCLWNYNKTPKASISKSKRAALFCLFFVYRLNIASKYI